MLCGILTIERAQQVVQLRVLMIELFGPLEKDFCRHRKEFSDVRGSILAHDGGRVGCDLRVQALVSTLKCAAPMVRILDARLPGSVDSGRREVVLVGQLVRELV